MQTILPYLDELKQSVKRQISGLLNSESVKQVATAAFSFHFKDTASLAFQNYYCTIIENRERFLATPDFFRVFKQRYSLQGIDGTYLDRLEREKLSILHLLESNELIKLYFTYFAEAEIKHGKQVVKKNLGSFFAKLVHTFKPDKYCALDNPIKDQFGLGRESFYIAFIIISKAYHEWASENSEMMGQIRKEFNQNQTAEPFNAKMTDLKLLDLIYWYQANEVMRYSKP